MSKKITKPHDTFIKDSLDKLNMAKPFLKRQLPARLAQLVNWDTLKLEKNTYIDNDMMFVETDKLYSVQIANSFGYIPFIRASKDYESPHAYSYEPLHYLHRRRPS